MNLRLFLFGILGILAFVGFFIFRESFTRSMEVREEAPAQTQEREEEILRAYFPDEFAQRKIVHLTLYDLPNFEEVVQPRPSLSEIIKRFGNADSIAEEDLSVFGVPKRGRVHYYSRLGLVTPIGRPDEVFWVLIAKGGKNSAVPR